ncbi:MAG: hypothetical protein ICV59_06365 [Thermoleophilia bacterium]|nr:hypothetical protein [Thermoleophilia bacterium]
MSASRRSHRVRLVVAGCAGLAAGLIAAAALVATAEDATGNANDRPSLDPAQLIDAAHLPPVLTAPGEPVELRYDVYCPPPDESESGAPCDAGGTVFVRAGEEGAFASIPLVVDPHAAEGRLVARVPAEVAGSPAGFSYYAVVRNRASGASLTLPAGGAAAPQRSLRLRNITELELGTHAFGAVRRPAERVFTARWGDGAGEVGLEGGREMQPLGPASFDVRPDGRLTVLDQVNRRALRLSARGAAAPAVPLAVNGTLADLAVGERGELWVLETAGLGAPLLREFAPSGDALRVVPLAERTASQIRVGPHGPVVKQYPSEEWLPAFDGRTPLGPLAQTVRGESARPLGDGRGVVVLRVQNELRVALVDRAGVARSWRIRSDTPLAEVQLAEPLGDRMVVVVRTYTERRDEFVVLVLAGEQVVSRFSVASADWAETAPLSRFRLAGSSLYQLGSTRDGVHVDRFDLEVT